MAWEYATLAKSLNLAGGNEGMWSNPPTANSRNTKERTI